MSQKKIDELQKQLVNRENKVQELNEKLGAEKVKVWKLEERLKNLVDKLSDHGENSLETAEALRIAADSNAQLFKENTAKQARIDELELLLIQAGKMLPGGKLIPEPEIAICPMFPGDTPIPVPEVIPESPAKQLDLPF